MRITQKMLEKRVDYLNKITGFENAEYSTIGSYCLDYAYGGVNLNQYTNEHGAVKAPFSCGFTTKHNLFDLINAYIAGILS